MESRYIKGPWRCSVCGGIFESLDEPFSGEGEPGKDARYVCKGCYIVDKSLPGDECWI